MIVVDASAMAASLLDAGEVGEWCRDELRTYDLVAPEIMFLEVANVIRRAELAGHLKSESAHAAFLDLSDTPVQYWEHSVLGGRIWELRRAVTAYDASYVAVAEAIDAPLMTLDARLAAAPGTRCHFRTPPGARVHGPRS